METIRGNTIEQCRAKAEQDYSNTPVSVLKYITVLEELAWKQGCVGVSHELDCDCEKFDGRCCNAFCKNFYRKY